MAETIGISWLKFLNGLPAWNDDYLSSNADVRPLETKIQKRAYEFGCLNRDSILDIVAWGGNPHGLMGRIQRSNTEDQVRQITADTMKVLGNPEAALGTIKRIRGLGDSFGSKVLAMLSPQTHAVWDRIVKNTLGSTQNPPISYGDFIELLQQSARQIPFPNLHRPDSSWWVRDVEAGLFQFAWPKHRGGNGGLIVGLLPSR